MNVTQTMKRLETLGTDTYKKLWPRHGVKPPLFGVKYADLYALQKKLAPDSKLAQQLWRTGNHDARILATLIVDPADLSAAELDAWLRPADNYVLSNAVAGVAARSPHAQRKADQWRKAKSEWKCAAGWDVVASMAAPGGAPDAWLAPRLTEIRKGVAGAANRARHSMNGALIAIGGYRPALLTKAVGVAKAIGKVQVDHGQTGCKTPDAVPYMRKVALRAKRKAARKAGKKAKSARR
ncbi:MAG: DNA alkylation repair protein, partial [Planctomycetota bacterium]|nr:DNA alkylation repair protein [Planctomycetota bacterium]